MKQKKARRARERGEHRVHACAVRRAYRLLFEPVQRAAHQHEPSPLALLVHPPFFDHNRRRINAAHQLKLFSFFFFFFSQKNSKRNVECCLCRSVAAGAVGERRSGGARTVVPAERLRVGVQGAKRRATACARLARCDDDAARARCGAFSQRILMIFFFFRFSANGGVAGVRALRVAGVLHGGRSVAVGRGAV